MVITKNKVLFLALICLTILGFFVTVPIQSLSVGIFLSLIIYIVFVFQKIDVCFSLMMLFLPLQGLFDNSGFVYFYNILIFLFALKLFYHSGMRFYPPLLVIIFLYIYNAALLFINFTDLSSFLGATSFFVSITCFLYASRMKEKLSFLNKRNLIMYFIGCLLSGFFSYFNLFREFGFSLDIRLVSLARDANYFATYCLCGFFLSTFYIVKIARTNSEKWLFRMMKYAFLILGLLTTSKMFLLLLVVGVAISILFNLRFYKIKTIVLRVFLIIGAVLVLYFTGILEFFIDRYIGRIDFSDITTGRVEISLAFLEEQFKSVPRVLFGVGTNYNNVYNIQYNSEHMSCHMAYLEMFLSLGLFGSLVFMGLIFSILYRFWKKSPFYLNHLSYALALFLLCALALPIFTNDAMWIFALYLVGIIYSGNKLLYNARGRRA